MSSMIDHCAELEREEWTMHCVPVKISEMTPDERRIASQWLTDKIRLNSGKNISFPEEWLPTTGLSARIDGGSLLAVATLYLEKSTPVSVCGWCIANPFNSARESEQAVRALLSAMPDYAVKQGAAWILTTFGNRGINRILNELGYVQGENSETKFKNLRA